MTLPVLLLHLVLWHEVAGSMGTGDPLAPKGAAMQVRTLDEAPLVRSDEPAPVVPAPPPRRPAPGATKAPAAVAPAPAKVPAQVPTQVPAQAPAPLDGLQLAAAPAATPTPPAVDTDPSDVPTYRTRLPSPVVLTYELRRGLLSGTGRLDWQPAGGRYTMRLDGRVAGLQLLVQTSEGAIDKAGVAPLRFTDTRRRGEQAANFRRDTQRITYSGPSVEHPLVPGTQDRLSWMVQLPAIVAANPERFGTPGMHISMFVSGARGDADVWTFQVQGTDDLAPGDGHAAGALKLVREPRKPHDTQVEVWLDAKRQYLPARARLTSGGDALELVLQRAAAP